MTKEQAKKYSATRGSWGNVNPVTKIVPDKKKEQNKKTNSKLIEIKYEISSGIPFKWEYEIENNKICEFVKKNPKQKKLKYQFVEEM